MTTSNHYIEAACGHLSDGLLWWSLW